MPSKKPTQKAARKQFVVGDGPEADFSFQEIENLVLRLTVWFNSPECDRKFDDPEGAAKEIIQQCLLAETKDGSPWSNCPHDFGKRIKVKAAYDLEKGAGIPISSAKHPTAVRRLDPKAQDGAKQVDDVVSSLVDFDAVTFRAQKEADILEEYPELDNSAHLPHVRRLSLLYAQQEMIDRELMLSPKPSRRKDIMYEMKMLGEAVKETLITLDIHPKSLREKMKENSDGTLGDLVARLDEDDEFAKRERMWALRAALQFWYMANHPNGRGDGPQMLDWEIWHATRSRPMAFTCECGRHYPSLVEGFTPKELRDYLVTRGVLIEEPGIPNLITSEDVAGLNDYIDSLPEVPHGTE